MIFLAFVLLLATPACWVYSQRLAVVPFAGAVGIWLLQSFNGVAGGPGGPPARGAVAAYEASAPSPAPSVQFRDASGRSVRLADFRGRVVLLNLWATWWGPCVQELPSLDRLQAQLGGADFQVVALSVDRRGVAAVRPYFAKLKIANLPIYVEPQNQLATTLGLQVLPSTIIIGPHGLMLGRMIGAAQWDAPESIALVRHYIEAARSPPPSS